MSGPGYLDLPIYHGDTFKVTFSVQDGIDLTGYAPLLQIRKNGTLVIDFSLYVTVSGKEIDVEVPGDPDPAGTGGIPRPTTRQPVVYDWDLQLTSPAGEVRTLLRGNAIVTADVSHV